MAKAWTLSSILGFRQALAGDLVRIWPLETGMVFSYHPRRNLVGGPSWSTGINEDIRITPTGALTFSGDWSHRWRGMR